MVELPTEQFVIAGETLAITTANPIPTPTLEAAMRRVSFGVPDDYAEVLTTHGAANIFGAQLVDPSLWRARSERLDDDPIGMTATFLPFAEKTSTNGTMLFCFRFAMSLRDLATHGAAGDFTVAFHGAPYAVVACHLPGGVSGARFEPVHRVVAPTFLAWIDQLVLMLRARQGR